MSPHEGRLRRKTHPFVGVGRCSSLKAHVNRGVGNQKVSTKPATSRKAWTCSCGSEDFYPGDWEYLERNPSFLWDSSGCSYEENNYSQCYNSLYPTWPVFRVPLMRPVVTSHPCYHQMCFNAVSRHYAIQRQPSHGTYVKWFHLTNKVLLFP